LTILDKKLWHTPQDTSYDFKFLLEKHGGKITPTLSRLALKAMSRPLFTREAEGDERTEQNDEAVAYIAMRNAVLLEAYLELVNDKDVEQVALNQAIDDSVIVGLMSRTLGSRDPDLDDIILLPAGPSTQYAVQPTEFTVLRRKSLGRAKLVVATINHQERPLPFDKDMITIRPSELTGPKANMQRLAKVLIDEQQLTIIEPVHEMLLADATSYLDNKIYTHFDHMQ
jgi:hypothetical protein